MAEDLILKACNVSGCYHPAFLGGRCQGHHREFQQSVEAQVAARDAAVAPAPKDHGIIFSAPMVAALLAGRKTQTRRLATSPLSRVRAGDTLWVRESVHFWSPGYDCEITFAGGGRRETGPATGEIPDPALVGYFRLVDRSTHKRGRVAVPAIHMPRWMSRLTLTVTDVRRHNARALTEEDAWAEGLDGFPDGSVGVALGEEDEIRAATGIEAYAALWDSLHPDCLWSTNPYVVALTFTVERRNIDKDPAK